MGVASFLNLYSRQLVLRRLHLSLFFLIHLFRFMRVKWVVGTLIPLMTSCEHESSMPEVRAPAPPSAQQSRSFSCPSTPLTSATLPHAEEAISSLRLPFEACYQKAFQVDSRAEGVVVIALHVNQQGKVDSMRVVEKNELLSEALIACMREVASEASFCPAGEKGATLQFPIRFIPRKRAGG